MKNKEKWVPSKFIFYQGKLRASRNKKDVLVTSRLSVDLTAEFYHSNLSIYAKGQLLDLGCGKVPLYEAYRDKVENNICVDWENTFHKNDFIDRFVDLNKSLPFEDSTFDTIILSDVLEHIQDPMLLWREMNRVLKKEGILIMNVPFHYWIHEHPFDYYRYTRYALEYFAAKSDFQIISIEELGGSIEVLTDFVSKNIRVVPILGDFFANLIQWSNLIFLKTKVGRNALKITSKYFTLSYGLVAKKVN